MPDEPQRELPERPQEPQQPDFSKPAPSMFETFAKGRIEEPRDIAGEVKKEMEGKETKTPETKEEIIMRLARGFDEQLKKFTYEEYRRHGYDDEAIRKKINNGSGMMINTLGKDYMFFLHHQTKQGDGSRQPLRILRPEEQFVVLELIPRQEVVNGEDHMLTATTELGRLPIFFIGSDGERYQAKNNYKLSPYTGEGKKVEEIWWSGDDSWGGAVVNEDLLSTVDFKIDNHGIKEREVPLQPGDFEQLKDIMGRMENGEIALLVPPSPPKLQ